MFIFDRTNCWGCEKKNKLILHNCFPSTATDLSRMQTNKITPKITVQLYHSYFVSLHITQIHPPQLDISLHVFYFHAIIITHDLMALGTQG